jgi:cation:H+ antiporter
VNWRRIFLVSTLSTLSLVLLGSSEITAGSWMNAVWTFPLVLFAAIIIAWGAEAAQFLFSQGLALAILAWLQALPEFAVEAVIAWRAGKDPSQTHLVTANFTGSLRLLVGLGWPLIYFTTVLYRKNARTFHERFVTIHLHPHHSAEVVCLGVPILYFFVIWWKGTLTLIDSAILVSLYLGYLWVLSRAPAEDAEAAEDVARVPRRILKMSKTYRNLSIALFLGGGLLLYFVANPFLNSMLGLALALGISDFVFVQWMAPFLSEFPEKVSAFYWARSIVKAPMALMNMVSANVNQWTVLVAMIPIVFSWSHGGVTAVQFDEHQRLEILLTIFQSLLGFLLLANMKFEWWEAGILFTLWLVQFLFPGTRLAVTWVYAGWIAVEIAILAIGRRLPLAFPAFARLVRVGRRAAESPLPAEKP